MGFADLKEDWILVTLSDRCCEVHTTKTDGAAEKDNKYHFLRGL